VSQSTKTVMIVEDEPSVRAMLSMMLKCEHYNVLALDDGGAALDMIDECRPDAILLDLALPTVSGWTVIDTLRRRSDTDTIPIVAISASQRFNAVGDDNVKAFLSKPFDIDTLLLVLDDVLH
jgi:CheY-like chemotaxis protein